MKKTDTFYVARLNYKTNPKAKPQYATEENGQTIGKTNNIMNAKRFEWVWGIIAWMGGHYSSYTPVKVTCRSVIQVKLSKWPPKQKIDQQWDS